MTLSDFVAQAASQAGCTVEQIRSPQRRWAPARQDAMRRAYEAGFSAPMVGRAFNRDHTTVLYAAGVLVGKKPVRP